MFSSKKKNKYDTEWPGPRFLRKERYWRLLLEVTGQLSDLVHLGLPLGTGVSTMAVGAPNRNLRALLAVVGMDLQNGLSLHEALARRSAFFPASYVDAVRMGEQTGRLDIVLSRLEKQLIRMVRYHTEVLGNLMYLAMLMLTLVVGTLLMIYVFPQFEAIYGSFDAYMSAVGRGLVVVHSYRQPFIIAIVLMILAFLFRQRVSVLSYRKNPVSRLLWRVMGYVPWLCRMYRAQDLAHISWQLEMLTWAGVSLDKALDDAAASNVSPAMAAALTRVAERVRKGASLEKALAPEKKSLFPAVFRGQIALGEQGGVLSGVFEQLAQKYESETLHRARMMLNIAAPLGVCCVGTYVFFVSYGFFTAVFGLSALVD